MAVFPPHVHPFAWGIAVAAAALMGSLAAPPWRMGAAGAWLAVLVVGALGVNLATALQPLQASRILALWGAYLCVFLYCAGLREQAEKPDGQRLLLGAVALSGSGLAAYGLYQSLFAFARLAAAPEQGLPEAVRARIGSGRAVATLGLPDALSGLLAMSLPVTVLLARSTRGGAGRRTLLYALALLQAAGIVATWSAGGITSLALAAAAALWWGSGRRKRTERLAVALVVTGLIGAALLLAARVVSTAESAQGNPLTLRAGNWKVALEMGGEHPMFGVGAGCYGIAFPPHRDWGMNESQFAHNSYLQLLAETGISIGSLAVVGAGFLAWRLLRAAEPTLLVVSCLSFLLHNAVDFTFYVPGVGLTFFCLAGLAAGSLHGTGTRSARGDGGGLALRSLAALGLATFALLVTRADIRREAARWAVRDDPSQAPMLAAGAVALNPFDSESRSLLSHLQLEGATRTGDPELLQRAEESARRAIELDPGTPHHWNHLGRVLLARGDPQGAYLALARAAQLYPIKIEYRRDRDDVGAMLLKSSTPVAPR